MDFPKVLTGLLSAAILVGCGSNSDGDGGGNSEPQVGAEYRGITSAAEISIESGVGLQQDAEAVVKAITFVRYEENIADYEADKHKAPIYLSNQIGGILKEVSAYIYAEMVEESISGQSLLGECGGSTSLSGNYSDFSTEFSNFCVLTGESSSIALNGAVTFQLENNDYAINFDSVSLNYQIDQEVTQAAFINGSFDYSETETESISKVNAYVKVDGVASSANITETCAIGTSNCQFNADFLADNGVVYRIEDLRAELAFGEGVYHGQGKLFIPDYGYVYIEYSGLQYCEDASIDSGYIFLAEDEDPYSPTVNYEYSNCGEVQSSFAEQGFQRPG